MKFASQIDQLRIVIVRQQRIGIKTAASGGVDEFDLPEVGIVSGTGNESRFKKHGFIPDGCVQSAFPQPGAGKVGTAQFGTGKGAEMQPGKREVGSGKIDIAEIDHLQHRSGEIGKAQIVSLLNGGIDRFGKCFRFDLKRSFIGS